MWGSHPPQGEREGRRRKGREAGEGVEGLLAMGRRKGPVKIGREGMVGVLRVGVWKVGAGGVLHSVLASPPSICWCLVGVMKALGGSAGNTHTHTHTHSHTHTYTI